MDESLLNLPLLADDEDKSSPLKNRIRKNYRHVRKWARRTGTNCFRIYDRDIKEFPLAIDFYAGRFCVHYFTSSRESEEPPAKFYQLVVDTLSSLFNIGQEALYWRVRIKREKMEQYEKSAASKEFFTVFEYGVKFKVNLIDYLDTGLFLDHRETRRYVSLCCRGKRVLNLFAYTCSFSVHAAVAGALYTKSVDLSNTYTAWGRDNFILNGIPAENHPIIREDYAKFLKSAISAKEKYDIIIIDPPTISRSKKMDEMFDVQIDYIDLIKNGLQLLDQGGRIFFSTNSRKFTFDKEQFPSCQIQEISDKTLPIDFHDAKIHRCWMISCL